MGIVYILKSRLYRDFVCRTFSTGWWRPIECLKLQAIFCKRATNYKALLRKMTYEDKASYDSTPPCSTLTFLRFSTCHRVPAARCVRHDWFICVTRLIDTWRDFFTCDLLRMLLCCSVLQCVAVCCSVLLQCVVVYCSCVLQLFVTVTFCKCLCVAVCCRVLHCVAVCCSVL